MMRRNAAAPASGLAATAGRRSGAVWLTRLRERFFHSTDGGGIVLTMNSGNFIREDYDGK